MGGTSFHAMTQTRNGKNMITKIIVVQLSMSSYRLDALDRYGNRSTLDYASSDAELARKLQGAKPREYHSRAMGKTYTSAGIEVEYEE